MEKTAYILLGIAATVVAIAIILALLVGFPFSIIAVLLVVAVALLFWKVLRERLGNKEDDHYSNTVER